LPGRRKSVLAAVARVATALAWAAGGAVGAPAATWAQGGEPRAESSSEADRLFEASAEHYRAGRFDRAAELLVRAHRISGDPVLLFNLAKAHEGRGDLAGAVDAYERYLKEALKEAKGISDRGAIEAKIATLRAQIEGRRALEDKAEAERLRAERAAREPAPSHSAAPWVVAGVGGLGIAIGSVIGSLATTAEDEAIAEPVQRDAASRTEDAESLALAANLSLAVGGAVLVAGVAWGVVDVVRVENARAQTRSTEARSTVSLRISPTAARLVVAFQ
jgi:tetratricopeptide (TPR) repeat protein